MSRDSFFCLVLRVPASESACGQGPFSASESAHPAFPGRGIMLQPLGCRDYSGFDLFAASIRKSGLEIENHCTDYSGFDLCASSIRNSGHEIRNRCTDCPSFDLFAASIRKSGLEIGNRCTDCPRLNFFAASIRKFELEIKNRCNTIVPASITARLLQVVAATMPHPILFFFAAKYCSSACGILLSQY